MPSEEVRFHSGGVTIAGTFVQVEQPVAAALLIPGGGRSDRNSDARLPGRRTLQVGVDHTVADALTEAGVSTLRYDKRGAGVSGGDYLRTGMNDRRDDVRAALGFLAARTSGLPLLATGHSEGAWYAAELAADGAVAGAVLLAAGARPGEQILTWQTGMIAATLPRLARKVLRIAHIDVVQIQRRRMARIEASRDDVIRVQGTQFNARWYREFAAYDPRPVLARIKVPVLAITGGRDVQVPPEDVAEIGRLVQGPFEGHVVGDLSHLFRPDPESAGVLSYRREAREPVSPEVPRLIEAWITSHWAGSPAGQPLPDGQHAQGDRPPGASSR
jgi:pimeloyl-ACP methyl ester carboxylesterase